MAHPGGRPPVWPAGHPLASEHIRRKYGTDMPDPAEIDFDPIIFQAFVSPSAGMKINAAAASMEVQMLIFGEHIDEALPLRKLAAVGAPLKVTVEVWPSAAVRLRAMAEEELDE